MAESSPLHSRICNHLTALYTARRNFQVRAVDGQMLQSSQSQSWRHSIFCNAIRHLWLGLTTLAILAVLFCLSFIIYPIQLALGIRMYRNPKYELKKWPKTILVSLLALSLLEISLLSAQLWMAYRQGSIEVLQLSPLKWWRYSKNVLVLGVFIAEILSPKFYTRYVDGWLERMHLQMIGKDGLDEAEKGLLKMKVLPEKRVREFGGEITEEKITLDEAEEALLVKELLPENGVKKTGEHIPLKDAGIVVDEKQ